MYYQETGQPGIVGNFITKLAAPSLRYITLNFVQTVQPPIYEGLTYCVHSNNLTLPYTPSLHHLMQLLWQHHASNFLICTWLVAHRLTLQQIHHNGK